LSWNVLKSKKPKELFKNEIGLLFIDGDHREKAVKKDLKWVSLVRKGGIIICHDYETVKILGPKLAIDDFNEQNEGVLKQISLIGNLIVFKKL
jgi:predicted O-methyltransferase YrrM